MARDNLHSRFEPAVSVRQARAVFVLRLDPVTSTERSGAGGENRKNKAFWSLSIGFSKPDGRHALSLARSQFSCVLRRARSHLQYLHVVRALALHRRHSRRRRAGGTLSFVSTSADHGRALSRDDADLGARHLCVARKKTRSNRVVGVGPECLPSDVTGFLLCARDRTRVVAGSGIYNAWN